MKRIAMAAVLFAAGCGNPSVKDNGTLEKIGHTGGGGTTIYRLKTPDGVFLVAERYNAVALVREK